MKTSFSTANYMQVFKAKENKNIKRSILLATALASYPMISNAQNNNINEAFDKFVYEEFTKADNNPTDYYINKSDYEVIDKWINDKHENSSFSCHHDMYMERFCSRRLAEINK